jgi:hypothetical protein
LGQVEEREKKVVHDRKERGEWGSFERPLAMGVRVKILEHY